MEETENIELTPDDKVEGDLATPAPQEPQEPAKPQLLTPDEISALGREAVVEHVRKVASAYTTAELRATFDAARLRIEALNKEIDRQRHQKFLDEGGDELDYKPSPDAVEMQWRTLYGDYRARSKAEHEAMEHERQQNLLVKQNIINNMQTLLQSDDFRSYDKQFRDLMDSWKQAGQVPLANARDINATYKSLVDRFYSNLKLFAEFRDMDRRKNYEEKIKLCEQAEEAAKSNATAQAFALMQLLHAKWKQIGPVPREHNEEIWQRFRAASNEVNRRHHKNVSEGRERLQANYEAKLALIKELDEINVDELKTAKDYDQLSKKITAIQERWKAIGYAPKDVNDKVYTDFRRRCNALFDRRRQFFRQQTQGFNENYKKKVALCEQAEALLQAEDRKAAKQQIVELQKEWKTIGQVPRKHMDDIWKRFRAACDAFFTDSAAPVSKETAEEQEANLKAKQAIINELGSFKFSDDQDQHLREIQQFRTRWQAIGHVPIKDKEEVARQFNHLIDKQFDLFNNGEGQYNIQRFKANMELLKAEADGDEKLNHERNKLISKLRQTENELVQLENNIGFFAQTPGSESMVAEVRSKITTARRNVEFMNQKLDVLDALL